MLGTSEFGPQGEPPEAMQALGEGYSVVKLRGLPWNVTVDDITTFLAPIAVPQGGVHLMNGANGRPSGLAYVELSSEADQKEAMLKDKQSIGGRYIDIFSCSQNELQARLAGGLERGSWFKMASTLSDDTAPSASLDCLKARAAPTHPGAQPEPLGSLPWPQELASGRPKVEDVPLSTTRRQAPRRQARAGRAAARRARAEQPRRAGRAAGRRMLRDRRRGRRAGGLRGERDAR